MGGVVVAIDDKTQHNVLDLLYVNAENCGKGMGMNVWSLIQGKYPITKVWETHTPYVDRRNIHFYINKCGFKAVEFFHPGHSSSHQADKEISGDEIFFRFEKVMNQ